MIKCLLSILCCLYCFYPAFTQKPTPPPPSHNPITHSDMVFEKVEVEKPLASRSESAEIYVIGFKYKAPAKIDPRLLDIKHLFQGGKEPLKVPKFCFSTFSLSLSSYWHLQYRRSMK